MDSNYGGNIRYAGEPGTHRSSRIRKQERLPPVWSWSRKHAVATRHLPRWIAGPGQAPLFDVFDALCLAPNCKYTKRTIRIQFETCLWKVKEAKRLGNALNFPDERTLVLARDYLNSDDGERACGERHIETAWRFSWPFFTSTWNVNRGARSEEIHQPNDALVAAPGNVTLQGNPPIGWYMGRRDRWTWSQAVPGEQQLPYSFLRQHANDGWIVVGKFVEPGIRRVDLRSYAVEGSIGNRGQLKLRLVQGTPTRRPADYPGACPAGTLSKYMDAYSRWLPPPGQARRGGVVAWHDVTDFVGEFKKTMPYPHHLVQLRVHHLEENKDHIRDDVNLQRSQGYGF